LLESGADVNEVNTDNKTSWDLAEDSDIKQNLEWYGAVAKTDQ